MTNCLDLTASIALTDVASASIPDSIRILSNGGVVLIEIQADGTITCDPSLTSTTHGLQLASTLGNMLQQVQML